MLNKTIKIKIVMILVFVLTSISVLAEQGNQSSDEIKKHQVESKEKQKVSNKQKKQAPDFVPSEKIKSDAFIAFPVDI